ncbi:TPA: Glu-tRNA(Gln) amidotransferase subunit GatD [Candidatus Woesearchaeota archaeon]|nr:Glu-tRNA(Gln) amidotransferase subunit GatD [Candidatus Woesearchaeota archaeon]HII64349.1 Glu-tRNA(Gln) amidotransferase subunit GatD [Candidatus Woesearchaeota archaeon]HII65334.1 Glu-tRNA(Gln) amidotransferase subunit GatD [Candidatus Woesearchaeota archaeon]HIJ19256.1 Glu-tRNA(Gln) amidotransferase subunit GatD [Candidatus Woesearchaeota archaeon]
MKPQAGDKVRVKSSDGEYEGILMPRPEIFEKGFLVLKLENGYNIGIDEKKVSKVDVLEQYGKPEQGHRERKHDPSLPTISILSFGGTISSKVDYRTGGTYADYTAEDFVQMMPELESVANLRARKVMGIMSEDMSPEEWEAMAKAIHAELNEKEVAGVVVTQGTDTLHFSTAAISFALRNLSKPVVFTAAQRSIDRGSSDAFMNLLCAVHAAKGGIVEVMTCMHGSLDDDSCLLIRGTKVRKMHTSRRDAFRPINELPLARVFPDGKIEVLNQNHRKRSSGAVSVSGQFSRDVGLLYAYPGMDPDILDFFLEKKYGGVVIAATALGHLPVTNERNSLIPKLKKLRDGGIPVFITTQTVYGRVHPYVYTNLRKLSIGAGCTFCEDMLPEVAYIKLCWILAQHKDVEKVRELMPTNIAGEITTRSDVESFLY